MARVWGEVHANDVHPLPSSAAISPQLSPVCVCKVYRKIKPSRKHLVRLLRR